MRPALALTALALLSTGPGPSAGPDDLVRAGNAAARVGELDSAVGYYADAATPTADPGLVAFNRGVVELRRGRHREAELQFLAALDDRDAPAQRRAAANYNLGLALLRRGGSSAVYRAAVAATERCLEASPDSGTLAGDAAHNLELSKLLWREARTREREATPPYAPDPPAERGPPPGPDPSLKPTGVPNQSSGPPGSAVGAKPASLTGPPRTTTQTTAGGGTLPVLPDAELFPPLTPDDARALLRRHAVRLAKDRAATAELLTGPERPDGRDW